ncbi:hypothetical protein F511_45662 [Dorcoceras hygrometricum]|uniref:Uncharacterized protein n=1 Tax=Dorcoceras hygrometricum TaxID=472368 RepID=A0A2Z7A2Y2_9LAMI|nr:hypothetical protein F511_45662 [Dorcoceras hygrometricum]
MLTRKLKLAGERTEQTSLENFEHQQLHASTPALRVANERAKLGELSATKIVKNRAGTGRNRREKCSNEQCRSRVSTEKRIRNIGCKML